jgi:hypothetical protein
LSYTFLQEDFMEINEIAKKQFEWVDRMGWHNKTVLESLALIASEVGEAVNECRNGAPAMAQNETAMLPGVELTAG